MYISIIIPVYNASKFLADLFEALERNEFEEGDEVLLVDNGSSDNSLELCKNQAEKYGNLYKVLQYTEKAGSYATRNYAVKQAKGELLVFTDSDTRPVPNWIKTIRSSICEGMVIAGKIQLEIVNNGLWEHFDTIAHLQSEMSEKNSSVATANMAVLRTDFDKIGYFEERFSGGDYEWSGRAVSKGMKINFIPAAMVYHPTRKTFGQILKKEQRIAYGAGNHQKNCNKALTTLVIKYVLKVFKIDTNIRYSKQLRSVGMAFRDIAYFNLKFMKIRMEQLKFAIRGYKMIDARSFGIK